VPLPATWKEATALVHEMNRRQFPAVPAEQWEEVARQQFNDDNGLPAPGYDPELAKAISVMDGPVPELWPLFTALSHVPLLAIRGDHSDILSAGTFREMRVRHPRCTVFTARGEGHAPLLKDSASTAAIADFLARTDAEAYALMPALTASA